MVNKMNKIYKYESSSILMSNKLFLFSLIFIFLITFTSATVETLGTYKQGSCINLIQSCSNCTYNNISSVIAPNSDQAAGSSTMAKVGKVYNRTFCSTSQIGTYIVNGFGDLDGGLTVWAYDFEVTPSGSGNTFTLYLFVLLVSGALITLGFSIKDGWFIIFGGLGLIILGIYSVANGIIGFKDTLLTYAISLFFIGVGAYLSINSGIQMINE